MPQAVPEPLRREIVRRHQAGETLAAIAVSMQLPFDTVRGLWRRFRKQGEVAFVPDYHRCAHPGPRGDPQIYAQALAYKRAHPSFGAGVIRLILSEWFAERSLPHPRTFQLWFQQAGLTERRARKISAPKTRAQAAHEVWQLDAKEGLRLADGSAVCVYSLVDEATGAALGAVSFSPRVGRGGAGAADPTVATGEFRPLGSAGADPGR
jgi:hypothetical protein